MTPDEYCARKAAPVGSTSYYAFLFLPPDRRRAATALHAFSREIEDVIAGCADTGVARTKLAWWRREVAATFAGVPTHPVCQALQAAIKTFGIRREQLMEIIDGMEMDLDQNRFLDFRALELYCHRVAGVGAVAAASIFGYSDAKTVEHAHALGIVCKLTGIVRGVGEVGRRGRIYLPADELQQFNVTAADILNARQTDNFNRLMAYQVDRALRCHEEALALLPSIDRRSQRPGLIIAAIDQSLLRELRADGYKVLTQRSALTPVRKLWIAWRTWIAA